MSAGTLTLTNNSAAVTGSGTAFTTELAAGDFIVVTVGGVPYTLPVKTVNSNTSLTLVSNYTGPTQSGAAWFAVPRVALNMVTAALVAQSAEALRGLNYDKQNWQSIFSGTGNVTVKLPDGSEWTGPAWNSFKSAARADILGSVSQSGGVPTGAIIEKGSNSNGEYTKFADGTLICRRRITTAELNTNINVPNNLGGFRGGQVLIPFAATFVGLPVGSGDVQNNPDGARCNVTADTTTQWTVGIHTNNSGNVATTHAVNLLAIGRWF